MRGVSVVPVVAAFGAAVASASPDCPGTATVTVFAENLTDAPAVDVEVDGEARVGHHHVRGGPAIRGTRSSS